MITRPKNINKNAQLISGVGASSWFYIEREKKDYRITRYSEEGDIECSRIFFLEDPTFNIKEEFYFTYISHCMLCTIIQKKKKYVFRTYQSLANPNPYIFKDYAD